MPTTARQLARPYQPSTRQNTRGQRISRRTLIEWACVLAGGIVCFALLVEAIEYASRVLARG